MTGIISLTKRVIPAGAMNPSSASTVVLRTRSGVAKAAWSMEPARDPNPMAPAMLEAVRFLGIPTFDDQNGKMMEGEGGAAMTNLRIRDGRRLSVFRTYTYPVMDRPNLTVLTGALVTRVVFDGKQAVGVEFFRDGQSRRIAARCEIIVSLGAINTPRVLMQSGIGDDSELTGAGVDVVEHLPGVGRAPYLMPSLSLTDASG